MSTNTPKPIDLDISPVSIEDEMKRSYLDYAMSVIVSRALPDVRDGLKPVHRRILYSMKESGYEFNKPYRKSARIVGDVMGKYHPHGDQSIYDAMVRMVQNFAMRLPLIDGQGNFGSMDGDRAAAMRYTEARMAKAAHSLLDDIDKETVDFQPNYDETTREPIVLPARFPNLLVNGAGGIAVGMATNIPPHNLGEVIDACCAMIDNPAVTAEELLELVPGPDFPTGGTILGRSGVRAAHLTGRGSVIMRGRTHFEDISGGRQAIIVTEVPYQVNKASMVEKIAELVREKKLEGISDIRDESDRRGVRVVIEVKRDAMAEVVLNQLFRYTPLQTSFGVNMLALNGGKPELLALRPIIEAFITFREEVIRRRTIFELGKARERAHTLVGLAIAVANLDPVIKLIREAPDPQAAREGLMARDWPAMDVEPLIKLIDEPGRMVIDGVYRLSEIQARAILDLRLHRLTGLERDKLHGELIEIGQQIEEYLHILRSRARLFEIMRAELVEMKEAYATPRRTTLEENEFEHDIEDLIQREEMVVTVTNTGYIKRVPLTTYRAQRRGGRGRAGMSMRDEDFVTTIFVVNTHAPLLFFSSDGMVYKMKVYRLPLGTPQARGKAMVNIMPLNEGERITTVMPLPEDEGAWDQLDVMFATETGNVRRNRLSDFTNVMSNGKIAMKLDEGDHLIGVATCTDEQDVLLTTNLGKAIRFAVGDVRVFAGRTSTGVRGIRLAEDDRVNRLSILGHVEASAETRAAYLKQASALRRASGETEGEDDSTLDAEPGVLSAEEFEDLRQREEFLLTVTSRGFGKRTSAYEYRVTGRGGQGIANIEMSERNGTVVAAFPIANEDQVMMITDGGQLIRMPVNDVRIAGRKTQGVTLFRLSDDGEHVVSVARLPEMNGNGDDGEGDDETPDESLAEDANGGRDESGEASGLPPAGQSPERNGDDAD
ncbi:DNA gyrase subunit A [Rhodospirillum rubrum]|uniref:DNA gyrase subunit A n=1 Tax=Rhodospirillum rubrum (strain ATCC 11170 / ATH 1.1.1 / DSM 467 / LMG 4362 / NCIMB 8255 / S1) TaxID=269796 RepID=Q2RTK1_RHORT|nr:DNA gyrase subunit A [Rhodospirillum rubrum]ABC22544.1 DNA gyrase subunit A [Rhodospirillum rubrum ATCC 11170]AEO48262.1 DNA gyrase subunit A [Rhodospirillum rubrum F11]MBK5954132.1 DNA gyrase subunit A [Rhodospirillum rubrum]QXG82173.1 DNA gyrase subunit A [Rhodospirillum rubrum]